MLSFLTMKKPGWKEGICCVCDREKRVIEVRTSTMTRLVSLEREITICQECAVVTAASLLAMWGYASKDAMHE